MKHLSLTLWARGDSVGLTKMCVVSGTEYAESNNLSSIHASELKDLEEPARVNQLL